MAPDELLERLRATFLQELDEQVRVLNSGLLAAEQQPDNPDTIRELFRAAHTIKGAARVAGFEPIEQACHALESVFGAMRDGSRSAAGADISLLLAAADALSDAGTRLRAGRNLDDAPLASIVPRLESLAEGRQPGPSSAAASPKKETTPANEILIEPRPGIEPRGQPEPRVDTREQDDMLRIPSSRLDALMARIGELVIASSRIVDRGPHDDPDVRTLETITSDVAAHAQQLRLRPFGDACEALPRAVRDVASTQEKEVELVLHGQDVEADRIVVDALREPLLHLVRNAVDHGIESPADRAAAGKPRRAQVTVAAELAGGRLVVTVSDDGAGVDEHAVRTALRERGMPVPKDREEVASAVVTGGFSTRSSATTISGRGVGVDLVRSAINRIGGSLAVDWTRGGGTRFVLECPPSTTVIRAVLVTTGGQTLAIPTAYVERLRRIRPAELHRANGRSMIVTDAGPVQLHSLAALLGPPLEVRPVDDVANAVLVSAGARRAALLVEDIVDEEEIMIRPLNIGDQRGSFFTGAAILASGAVALVIGVPALLASSRRHESIAVATVTRAQRKRVIVADDSITTRTLEQSVLEAAGYAVTVAFDGQDAWDKLLQDGADAVVADVEMPRMDGITLARRIRASEQFARLPMILVTGLSSNEDRDRGMDAGADAYIVKSTFDQAELLATLEQLIGDT